MELWIALVSGLCVAVPNILATILTNKNDSIEKKLTNMSVNFDNKLNKLEDNLQEEKLDRCKTDLVSLMSKIANGYSPTVEEKFILYEIKNKYNCLGGDSYVDDMFEKLKTEGRL